ncbi:MAG: NADH-quinone oxidoreductase subunit H [Spirochaetales bacterium]|nr:NADH-quinone oxidoreductase subunit H [Spirochaetales bacterium]
MDILLTGVYVVFFPGFFTVVIIGLLSSWVDRKVTARVQYRKGPPLLQPFYDVVKLLGKETILPKQGSRFMFILAPLIGFVSISIVAVILMLRPLVATSFVGDLIVVVYLLTLPSLALIIGGAASGNPLAAQGASREIKLILAYELPFLIAIALIVYKAGFKIDLQTLSATSELGTVSGIISFIIVLLCVQAKLGFVPFDIAEAETEIMSGPYIEYSGPLLSVFKITQSLMLFTLPVFMITVFWGGIQFHGWELLWFVIKYVVILVLIIVIKNTNPRVRIDQALKFFWGFCTVLAIIAFVLAVIGNTYGIAWL